MAGGKTVLKNMTKNWKQKHKTLTLTLTLRVAMGFLRGGSFRIGKKEFVQI